MGSTKIFFLLSFLNVVMAAFLVSELGGVGGEMSRTVLSEEEEEGREMERQLSALNKPARKSFQDLDGSIYDSVDINKQPALDHPLLKIHEIQTEPPSLLSEIRTSRSFSKPVEIGVKGAECPPGTVIIRRTRKDDLLFARKHS